MSDGPRPDRRSQLCGCGLYGHRRHGVGKEYSWRRRFDDLELGLTKDKVILVDRERKIGGDTLLSNLHRTDAPGGFHRRFILRPEDLTREERRCDFPDRDDPTNRAEQ